MPPGKPGDLLHGLLDFFERRGVGAAHVAGTAGAERIAGDDGDVLFLDELLGELFR